jgi:hypothetical protein
MENVETDVKQTDIKQLDQLRLTYKTAVDEWVAAIHEEEGLATPDHSVRAIDIWENAHFREEDARNRAKAAKAEYEDALRRVDFGF